MVGMAVIHGCNIIGFHYQVYYDYHADVKSTIKVRNRDLAMVIYNKKTNQPLRDKLHKNSIIWTGSATCPYKNWYIFWIWVDHPWRYCPDIIFIPFALNVPVYYWLGDFLLWVPGNFSQGLDLATGIDSAPTGTDWKYQWISNVEAAFN